jgi:putative restriction endonuclease
MDIAAFLKRLSTLKVDRSKGAPAPHKPVLLLALLESIENGEVLENKVFITPELVARFKDTWHSLVKNEKFIPNFSLPFYHLKGDKFWHLKTLPGWEISVTSSSSVKSFSALKNAVAFACFEDEVYGLLLNIHNRNAVKRLLLDVYFAGKNLSASYTFIETIASQILNESQRIYQQKIDVADDEELFVRSGVFKKVVPMIYGYTCCISGLKINATRNIQMIDACHIVPFAESHDDTIKNGISLSPNLHRAFDRYMISINENYEVVVSAILLSLARTPLGHFTARRYCYQRNNCIALQ